MNKIKKSIKSIPVILLIALSGAVSAAFAQEAVNVKVVNTPTVNLPRGSSIGIDSLNNTVKIDPSSLVTCKPEKTVLIYDSPVTFNPFPEMHFTYAINLSEYSKIRVLITYDNDAARSVWVKTRIHPDNGGLAGKALNLEDILMPGNEFATQRYELPGLWMSFVLSSNQYDSPKVRIQVYGRK